MLTKKIINFKRDGDEMSKIYKNLVNGQWVEGQEGRLFDNINPAITDEVIGKFQKSTGEDLEEAIIAARKAFPEWKKFPAYSRGKILFKASELLKERCEEIAKIMTLEMGKSLLETRGEVTRAAQLFEWYGGEAKRLCGETFPSDREKIFLYTIRQPLGVVALITPWNFPIAIPAWKLGPALVTGNTVILKPASLTPLTAIKLGEVLQEAGLPSGVLNIVTGSGSELGQVIATNEAIKAISFTGSTKVGMKLHSLTSCRMVKTQYEMGGKNPIIVLKDGDVKKAAEFAIAGAMWTAGQKCTATSRAIVVKEVAEEFIENLLEELKHFKVGNGLEEGVRVGPVADEHQLTSILKYIEKGKEEGAKLIAGGNRITGYPCDRGYFVEPTIFIDVKSSMTIAQEEIFGPVLSVITVEDFDEALKVANDVEYGLSASIITNNITKAMEYVDKIEAGMIHVNYGTAGAEVQVPFGGMKKSSFGYREQGKEAVKFYSDLKTVYLHY